MVELLIVIFAVSFLSWMVLYLRQKSGASTITGCITGISGGLLLALALIDLMKDFIK